VCVQRKRGREREREKKQRENKIVFCCVEQVRNFPIPVSHGLLGVLQMNTHHFVVYYETIKRELNKRFTYEFRCDERLKSKVEGST
jgi:hypothetical protein